jgi:hypothetical protein
MHMKYLPGDVVTFFYEEKYYCCIVNSIHKHGRQTAYYFVPTTYASAKMPEVMDIWKAEIMGVLVSTDYSLTKIQELQPGIQPL